MPYQLRRWTTLFGERWTVRVKKKKVVMRRKKRKRRRQDLKLRQVCKPQLLMLEWQLHLVPQVLELAWRHLINLELRKRRIEADMEGGETPQLPYQVIPEKKNDRIR